MKYIFLILIIFPVILFAGTYVYQVDIETPVISGNQITNYENHIENKGDPRLPYVNVTILLPMGEELTNVAFSEVGVDYTVSKVAIDPSYGMYSGDFKTITQYFSKVYDEDKFFPEETFYYLSPSRLRGFELLTVSIIPYKYNPKASQLSYNSEIKVTVSTQYNNTLHNLQSDMLLSSPSTEIDFINRSVVNPSVASTYVKAQRYNTFPQSLVDANHPHNMIIITEQSYIDNGCFDDYVEWRESNGYAGFGSATNGIINDIGVYSLQNIYSTYTGDDNADKIRNFIIDAYQTFSSTNTPLNYVMLNGDITIIPSRHLRVHDNEDHVQIVECDTYFGGLDDDWKNNNGSYNCYRNDNNADFVAEVSIGRLPIHNSSELFNILNKTMNFFSANSNKWLLAGGWLVDVEALRVQVGTITAEYNCEEFYDAINGQENIELSSVYNSSDDVDISSELNEGFGLVYHFSHANEVQNFGLQYWQVANLTNTSYSAIISAGCSSMDYDSSIISDSIGERFITASNGAYLYCGNTDKGWFSSFLSPTHGWIATGPSLFLDKEIAYWMSNDSNNPYTPLCFGAVLDNAKCYTYNNIPAGTSDLWLYQLASRNLLGDPSIVIPFFFPDGVTNLNGTLWDNQIYPVYGDVTVGVGSTFTMMPGSQLLFMGDFGLTVNGSLQILGTEENPVTISGHTTGWQGITFENTSSSVSSTVSYCEISNCVANNNQTKHLPDPSIMGAAIYAHNADNLTIDNCTFSNNIANHEGGAIYLYNSDTEISDCTFIGNLSMGGSGNLKAGGAVFIENSDFSITDCYFEDNSGTNGGALCIHNSTGTIDYSTFVDNRGTGAAMLIKNSSPTINNCTITKHYRDTFMGYITMYDSDAVFNNSIIQDNDDNQIKLNDSDPIFNYCNIQHGRYEAVNQSGVNNPTYSNIICKKPYFIEDEPFSYRLKEHSACVDTGDPTLLDSDGTVRDMGAQPIPMKVFYRDVYNWTSFPKLANTTTTISDAFSSLVPDTPTIDVVLPDESNAHYESNDWTGQSNNIVSQTACYKVKTDDDFESYRESLGQSIPDNTTINLGSGENKVGYWLKEPQTLRDAFSDENGNMYSDWWDKIESVQSQYVYYQKPTSGGGGGNQQTKDDVQTIIVYDATALHLEYGKGYVVTLYSGETIQNFSWNPPTVVSAPPEILKPQNFEFTYTPEYEAIDIVSSESITQKNNEVTEIGAFDGETCIGAVVVEQFPVQLLTYPLPQSKTANTLEFRVIYANKSDACTFKKYQVLNCETNEFEQKGIKPGENLSTIVKLSEPDNETHSVNKYMRLDNNYPNPFNPTTSISFYVPKASEVSLDIYNIKGQKIKTLHSGKIAEGQHTLTWNGEDNNNEYVASGVYFYRLKNGNETKQKKMLLLK